MKQVDELDAELTELESTVQGLDEYTRKLGLLFVFLLSVLPLLKLTTVVSSFHSSTEVRFRKISKVLGKV